MVKKIIIYIMNFFLVIFIFTLSSLLIFSNTILNKQYIKEILEKNNYYEKTYYNIQNDFENYILQSGLDKDILNNLYDMEKVNSDINMVIDAIYDGSEIKVDTTKIIQELDDRINEVLKQNNREPEKEEREEIEIFENTIAQVYYDGITYSIDDVKEISNIIKQLKVAIKNIEMILIVVSILELLIILFINKSVRKNANTLGIMMLTVGIIGIAIKILIGDRTHDILILNLAFSASLIDLINSIISKFFILGVTMSVIGLVIIILSNCLKRKLIE